MSIIVPNVAVIPYWFKHYILRQKGKHTNSLPSHYSFDTPLTLKGLLPPAYDEATHFQRSLAQLRSKNSPLEKYIYLSQLRDANVHTFYKLCSEHLAEITPLIYTPTVGDACLNYSHIYRRPEGLYVTIKDKGNIGEILQHWPHTEEARIAVVTDGSRILGLGDLGVNGMPISIGKLSLYVAGAGIHPSSTLPICLDLGTNNEKFLEDPLYLGLRQKRISGEEMTEFMNEFMREMSTHFPKLLVQFEDFSTDNAFKYLELYRNKYPTFNDDIQGTGAVVLSGFINAAKLSSAASGLPPKEQRILFFGAGSAGVGVAKQLLSFFKLEGLSDDEGRERIWFVDSQGLVYNERGPLPDHKKYFSRKDYTGPPIKKLIDVIDYVKPTAVLGLSTVKDAFDEAVVERMAELNPRPIIFPLSNPVRLSEVEFKSAVEWTNGKVIFASGSPYDPVEYKQKTHYAGQGNNMYIFPGLGLGSILAKATSVTDTMVEAASLGLANSLTKDEVDAGLVYPRIERIREISAQIAVDVIRAAQKAETSRNAALKNKSDEDLKKWVMSKMWNA